MESRTLIYKSFVESNFTHCPLVWHFCGKVNNAKLEKIQERALKIIYRSFSSSYPELLDMAHSVPLLTSRERLIILEVFKCIKKLNPECLWDMFHVKELCYSLRSEVKLEQPRRNTTNYGIIGLSGQFHMLVRKCGTGCHTT